MLRPAFHLTQHDPVKPRLDTVYAALVAAAAHGEDPVHLIRTTIKRLRALWRLVRPAILEKTFESNNATLRNTARTLAEFRDKAAHVKSLEKLLSKSEDKETRESGAVVLAEFVRKQAEREAQTPDEKIKSTLNQMRRTLKNFQDVKAATGEWKLIGPGVKKIYRTAKRRMKTAAERGNDLDFHDWRKAVKYLMYHLELLAPSAPEHFEKLGRRLKKLEKSLGRDHDLTTLTAHLNSDRSGYAADDLTKVIGAAESQKKDLRPDALARGKKLFESKPRSFEKELKAYWSEWRKA